MPARKKSSATDSSAQLAPRGVPAEALTTIREHRIVRLEKMTP